MKEYKLQATTQKSYYGKAKVIETENGESLLKSYETIVCKVTASGDFVRLWGGYSNTTKAHINDFRRLFGFAPLNKKEWESIPVSPESESDSGERYKVRFSNGFVNWTAGAVFDNEEDACDFADSVCAAHQWRVGYHLETV